MAKRNETAIKRAQLRTANREKFKNVRPVKPKVVESGVGNIPMTVARAAAAIAKRGKNLSLDQRVAAVDARRAAVAKQVAARRANAAKASEKKRAVTSARDSRIMDKRRTKQTNKTTDRRISQEKKFEKQVIKNNIKRAAAPAKAARSRGRADFMNSKKGAATKVVGVGAAFSGSVYAANKLGAEGPKRRTPVKKK